MSNTVNCKHCNKEYSKYAVSSHERKCVHNKHFISQDVIDTVQELHNNEYSYNEIADKIGISYRLISELFSNELCNRTSPLSNRKGGNQYTKAKRLGLSKPEVSEETRLKLSKCNKNKVWTQEMKDNHSKAMKKTVRDNPDSYSKKNVSGRVKHYEYKGVVLKGTWELKMAMWLDAKGIQWEYETMSYPYPWNDGYSIYFPDFYLPQYNTLIEVKGNITERDVCKWDHLPITLVVVDKTYIHSLDKLITVLGINDNGVDIDVELYDSIVSVPVGKNSKCKNCDTPIRKNKTGYCKNCVNSNWKRIVTKKRKPKKKKSPPIKKIKLKKVVKIKPKCIKCDTIISKNKTGLCEPCYKKSSRKVDRPSYEQLLEDLETLPYTKVGKKYGVSDNCIRKWIKYYRNLSS